MPDQNPPSAPPSHNTSEKRQVVSVTQLNRQARQLLESGLGVVWVEGEISNFKAYGSGHWYFTLKDAKAQISCAMFRNRNMYINPPPKEGQQVLIQGKISLYEERGNYQLIAENMEAAGEGLLRQAYERLKKQLQQEGLFDKGIKKPLPAQPKHIGIVTSPTGAAIRDMISVARRRFPLTKITVFPCSVQGENAPSEIVNAIQFAGAVAHRITTPIEVLIIGRGGGSLEDLMAFNDEQVARAIHACPIPTVSAVGHETDITIADWVADQRAPTPSAAAEILTLDQNQLIASFHESENRLHLGFQSLIQQKQQQLDWQASKLQHPGERISRQKQSLTEFQNRLVRAFNYKLESSQVSLKHQQNRLQACTPSQNIDQWNHQIKQLSTRLQNAITHQVNQKKQYLSQQASLLNSLSPLNTLSRGYSITQIETGKHESDKKAQTVITDIEQCKKGMKIRTRLANGEIISTITSLSKAP